jgi:hypothetical protein
MSLAPKILIALSFAITYSQPVIDLTSKPCSGDAGKPKLAALLPATVAGSPGTTVMVPVCLSIGAGLRINMDAPGGPTLETDQTAAPPQLPRMVTQHIDASTFGDKTSVAVILANTPAPGTLVLAYYKGAGWWANQFDAISPSAGKAIGVILPSGRTMSPGDYVMLVYWTTEQPPAAVAAK